MKRFLLAALLLCALSGYADAAILVMSTNGTYTTKTTLEVARTAADAANKTIVVTSTLTAAQSDITGAWPADRALKVEKGGSITNSTAFAINGPFAAGLYKAFGGVGTILFGDGSVPTVYPEWFGAVGNGITNDAIAIQAAISATPRGSVLKLSNKSYLLSGGSDQLLLITKPILLEGSGSLSMLYVDGAVGASTDVIRISPDMQDSADGAFFALRDFSIVPATGYPARDAIRLDVTAAGQRLKSLTIERLKLEQLGGRGIQVINPTNPDGFFTSVIQNNVIVGGIYLNKAGDSIRILNNTITGALSGWGVYADLVVGANSLFISGNNITAAGGCILVEGGGTDARIMNNNLESIWPITEPTNPDKSMVVINGVLELHRTATIAYNTFSMLSSIANIGVLVDNAHYTHIDSNYFGRSNTLTQQAVVVRSSAIFTFVDSTNLITGADEGYGITDDGVATRGVYIPMALVSPAVTKENVEEPSIRVNSSKDAIITGTLDLGVNALVDGYTLFTLPVGARPKAKLTFVVPCFTNNIGDEFITLNIAYDGVVTLSRVGGKVIRTLYLNGITFHAFS